MKFRLQARLFLLDETSQAVHQPIQIALKLILITISDLSPVFQLTEFYNQEEILVKVILLFYFMLVNWRISKFSIKPSILLCLYF